MYILKETAKDKKAKAARRARVAEPKGRKAKEQARKQMTAVVTKGSSVGKRTQVPKGHQPSQKKDPVKGLRELFSRMDLPTKLVPENVVDFHFDSSSSTLSIELKNSFTKQFDADNAVTFEKHITAVLENGRLAGISGIKRGSARIVEISRSKPGEIAITGRLGPFSKTLRFMDSQLPALP